MSQKTIKKNNNNSNNFSQDYYASTEPPTNTSTKRHLQQIIKSKQNSERKSNNQDLSTASKLNSPLDSQSDQQLFVLEHATSTKQIHIPPLSLNLSGNKESKSQQQSAASSKTRGVSTLLDAKLLLSLSSQKKQEFSKINVSNFTLQSRAVLSDKLKQTMEEAQSKLTGVSGIIQEQSFMKNMEEDYSKALINLARQRTYNKIQKNQPQKRGNYKQLFSLQTFSQKAIQTINQRLENETNEIIKSHSLQHRAIKDDAAILLIKRPNLNLKQKTQARYYETVVELIKSTQLLMLEKQNFVKIKVIIQLNAQHQLQINMNSIVYIALVAQDPEVLKLAHLTFGYICIILRQFSEGKKQFKFLKDVCEDLKDYENKIVAYRMLGVCYKQLYQYKISANCYKKMLSLAWDIGNQQAEILAYEQLGMIYYYKGQLDRAKYYSERATRGWYENDNSQLKKIQKRDLQNQRQRKLFNYGTPNLNNIFQKFQEMSKTLNSWIQGELDKVTSTVQSLNEDVKSESDFYSNESIIAQDLLEDTADVYREFMLSNKNNMGLRPGSLLSNASAKTLPSPKGLSSNIESLPNFNTQINQDIQKEKNYFNHTFKKEVFKNLPYEIFKSINPRHKLKPQLPKDIYPINKEYFKSRNNSVRSLKTSQSQNTLQNKSDLSNETDIYQLIKDNQMRRKGEAKLAESNYILYTHMNPFRVSPFALKSANIQNQKFLTREVNSVENILKKELVGLNYKEAKIGKLTKSDLLDIARNPKSLEVKAHFMKNKNILAQTINQKVHSVVNEYIQSNGYIKRSSELLFKVNQNNQNISSTAPAENDYFKLNKI